MQEYGTNIGQLQQQEVNKMLQAVIDSGINFIDTADIYSFGQTEQLLGQGLKDLKVNRDEVVITTKINTITTLYRSLGGGWQ